MIVYNLKMIRILVLFLIFIIFESQSFAFSDFPGEFLQNTAIINQNKKIFHQNIQLFENFLCIQEEFPQESRFFIPNLFENKQKDLSMIVIALYFNILKDEKLQEIQKKEITLQKTFLDEMKKISNLKEIQEANEDYNQAQIMYLAYKKSSELCIKQLRNFSCMDFDLAKRFDDFDIDKIVTITDEKDFSSEQRDVSEHLKYEYKKYKNLKLRIETQAQNIKNDDLESQYELLEQEKSLAVTKLKTIVYYYNLKESIN